MNTPSRTTPDNSTLVQGLVMTQEMEPFHPVVLVGARAKGTVLTLTPELIAQWLEIFRFPSTEAEGVVNWGCSAARIFVEDGDLVEWALAVYRAPGHWTIFTDVLTPTGDIIQGRKELKWSVELAWAARLARLEGDLPELRRAGFLSPAELQGAVSFAKANARDELAQALRELADLSSALGHQAKAASYRAEYSPFLAEALQVEIEGVQLFGVDDTGQRHEFSFGR